MLNNLNQPKGSTIGVLKDGRTIQQAIDGLENPVHYVKDVSITPSALLAVAVEAARLGRTVAFGPGHYTNQGQPFEVDFPLNLDVPVGTFLDFPIIIRGKTVKMVRSVTTNLTAAQCPAGTTVIAGDFSAFPVGSVVGVKLGDNTNGSASYNNEAGWDFTTVAASSNTSITLSTGLRWAFDKPEVFTPEYAVRYSGQLSRSSYFIPGDYTSGLNVGDIIRVENIDGTDGVHGNKEYFEMLKVSSIDSSGITVETRLRYTHVNPWIVKTGLVKGSSVTGGGRLKRLEVRGVDTPKVNNVDVDRLIVGLCYNIDVGEITSRGVGEPSSVNFTFCFGRGFLYNVRASGSVSTTDNSALKLMSCPGLIINNCSPHNSTSTGSQGDYGFYVDAYYSPYWCWNDGMSINGIVTETPRSAVTRALWLFGLRGCSVSNLSGAQVFLQGCAKSVFSNIVTPDNLLELRDLSGCIVSGMANNALVLGCWNSTFDLTLFGIGSGSNLNIALRAGAGVTHPETGVPTTLGKNNTFNVKSFSPSSLAVTLSIAQQERPIFGAGCVDVDSANKSVALGSNVTVPTMLPLALTKGIDSGSGWVGGRTKGGIWFDGNYRDAAVRWNGQYVWVADNGSLKAAPTKPDSDSPSNGVVIGP